MAEPLLQVERLHKRFPVQGTAGRHGAQLHAVDDVNLVIGRGESLGLVGESGCGKSTLLRLLARLHDPTEGRIVFDGHDLAASRRHVSPATRSGPPSRWCSRTRPTA